MACCLWHQVCKLYCTLNAILRHDDSQCFVQDLFSTPSHSTKTLFSWASVGQCSLRSLFKLMIYSKILNNGSTAKFSSGKLCEALELRNVLFDSLYFVKLFYDFVLSWMQIHKRSSSWQLEVAVQMQYVSVMLSQIILNCYKQYTHSGVWGECPYCWFSDVWCSY